MEARHAHNLLTLLRSDIERARALLEAARALQDIIDADAAAPAQTCG